MTAASSLVDQHFRRYP